MMPYERLEAWYENHYDLERYDPEEFMDLLDTNPYLFDEDTGEETGAYRHLRWWFMRQQLKPTKRKGYSYYRLSRERVTYSYTFRGTVHRVTRRKVERYYK